MAISAFRSSSSLLSASSGQSVTPMLLPILILWPFTVIGVFNNWLSRRAKLTASSMPLTLLIMKANSSPPNLATVSIFRPVPASLNATSLSNSSPASWPMVSLIILKLSRSIKKTANLWSWRLDSATACCNLSWNNNRLGKPVSESCSAKCFSLCSAWLK